jgi:hypothetical protein
MTSMTHITTLPMIKKSMVAASFLHYVHHRQRISYGHAGCLLMTGDPQPSFQKHASCDMKENQRSNKIPAPLVGLFGAKDGKRRALFVHRGQ